MPFLYFYEKYTFDHLDILQFQYKSISSFNLTFLTRHTNLIYRYSTILSTPTIYFCLDNSNKNL